MGSGGGEEGRRERRRRKRRKKGEGKKKEEEPKPELQKGLFKILALDKQLNVQQNAKLYICVVTR